MPTKDKLRVLFGKKKKIVKDFMNVLKHPKIEIANVTLQEGTFSDEVRLGKICEVFSMVYCDQATTELSASKADDLIHEVSQPMAKIFAPKYKTGQKIGKLLKADLEEKLKNVKSLGFKETKLPKILKAINKFQRVAGGEDVSESEEETLEKETKTTARSQSETADSESSNDELDISSYVEKAKEIYKQGSLIKDSVVSLVIGIGKKVEGASKIIADDKLIKEAELALVRLKKLDIDLFLENEKKWEETIPKNALRKKALANELKKLSALSNALRGQKTPREKLIEKCHSLKVVQSPTKMKIKPISSIPIAHFGNTVSGLEI